MFFLCDIALMLELFGFCIALVLLHYASKENSGLVRTAGIILLLGSLVVGACTAMNIYKRRAFIGKEISAMKDSMKKDSSSNE